MSTSGPSRAGRQADDDFQETASFQSEEEEPLAGEPVAAGAPEARFEATRPGGPAPAPDPPAAAGATARAGQQPLALLEALDRDGRVRHRVAVHAWPVAVGRALDNDLVLDDPHVAPHHARIEAAGDGGPELLALPSVNGVVVGSRPLAAGERQALGASHAGEGAAAPIEIVAGATRVRVRLAAEVLEPERPLPAARHHAGTVWLALALWTWVLAGHSIGLDPGSKATEWLPPLVGAPLAVGGWCLLWALASKLFQHRFEFWPHLAVAVRGLLAVELCGFLLPWLSAVSGWPGFSRVTTGVAAAAGVLLVLAHARLVLPHQARSLALAALAAYVAGTGILLALNLQRNDRWFNELYSSLLPPPALQWMRAERPEAFLAEAATLRPALEEMAAEAAAERRGGEDAEEE